MMSAARLPVAAVLLITSLSTGSSAEPSPAEWVPDVDLLLEQMASLHPDLYHHTPREQWRAAADDLKRRLPELKPHVAVLEFRRLMALSGDGRTYFRPPADAWGPALYLPLFLRRFESGWYVRTGHVDYADLFGKRIVAIEGLPLAEIVRRLEPYAGSRNRMRVLDVVPQLLRLPQVLHTIGVTEELARVVSVTAADASGSEVTLQVTAGPDWISDDFEDADARVSTPKPAYRGFDDNFDFVHYPEQDAMYFYFGEVRDSDDETIAAFTDRLFDAIEDRNIGRLVIDLRENNGGNLYLVQPLVHAVIRRAYPPGSLFVLIGRDTWSAAMALAVQLERETSAIFVGEPTPSPPNFWGDTEPIELPASGIVVECSSLWWQFSDPRDVRPWIAPDVAATESFEDFMAHRDVALDAVWTYRAQTETLAPGSVEVYELPTSRLPAIRWQRASQASYQDEWMR